MFEFCQILVNLLPCAPQHKVLAHCDTNTGEDIQ